MSRNLKNIGLVSSLTMVSRVLGLVRESVTAAFFGTGALMSAFVTGLQLPNLFRRLLAEGGMTAAFVPTLNEQLHARHREGAFELVNKVTSWLLAATGALVIAAMLLFSQTWAIRGFGSWIDAEPDAIERWLLAAHFTVLLFPYLLFVSLAAAFSAALQSLNRFLEPALSPIWLNVSIIGLLGAAAVAASGQPELQIRWLTAGWLVGGIVQMVVPGIALMREGWHPRLDFVVTEPLRRMVRLMVPTLFSSSIYLVNMTASRYIGLSLNDQAVSVLNFAQRIMELPIGVFAVAVATVVFPLISRHAAAGDTAELAAAYRKGMRLILLINIPAAIGIVVLAEPIIRVIFQYGAFAAEDTSLTAPVLVANAAGLPFLSFASLALRAFYAQRDTRIPVRAALLSFVVNIGLSIVLMQALSIVGLAIASSVAAAVQAAYLQWHLARKQEGLAFHHLGADVWKIVLASAVMGVVIAAAWRMRATFLGAGRGIDVAVTLAVIAIGMAVFAASAWLLRVEARQDVDALWERLSGRFKRG